MSDNQEALRLADALEAIHENNSDSLLALNVIRQAGPELRRLHAENEALKATLAASCDEEREQLWEAGPGGGCLRALDAERLNAELVEALKWIGDHDLRDCDLVVAGHMAHGFIGRARAALEKVEASNES